MKNFYGKSAWLILLCCLSFVIGRAQVSLSADASPSTVGLDEYVSYRIIIENAASIQQLTPFFRKFSVSRRSFTGNRHQQYQWTGIQVHRCYFYTETFKTGSLPLKVLQQKLEINC
jgi:hypothetical protein